MRETIYRDDAIDEIRMCGYDLKSWQKWKLITMLKDIPSAQQDDRLNKIAELVEGTIYHFDRDDAMDLLYQIKEVIAND